MSCSMKQDLVGGPGKTLKQREGVGGGKESMHVLCKTPDTVVSVNETFFLNLLNVPCASGEQT